MNDRDVSIFTATILAYSEASRNPKRPKPLFQPAESNTNHQVAHGC